MTRPSANLDKKMLEAGLKIIIKEGSKGLTARNICKVANVNLGMFSYLFKTKENYLSILYHQMHEKMEKYINLDSVKDLSSIDRLKHALLKMAEFSTKREMLSRAIFLDGLMLHKEYSEYMRKGIIPRQDILLPLIEEAKKDGYLKSGLPTAEIMGILGLGGIVPGLFVKELNEVASLYNLDKENFMNENFFAKRIEILLKGLEG